MSIKEHTPVIHNRYSVSRLLILFYGFVVLVYTMWWLNITNAGNPVLYVLLLLGEIYHVWQALGYVYTIWNQQDVPKQSIEHYYPVDIFITVCGEPVEVVEKTLKAVFAMDYPNKQVYILNDGRGRNAPGWQDVDNLALRYGATPITREKNVGAKAGNINNALRQTTSPFVAIFDADHAPEPDFLTETMGFFKDDNLALVQTPQYYENKDQNFLTRSAWEQQELFFGPICRGKNRVNATFWCGTNAVVRRKTLEQIGGVPENNIAEDFLGSLFFHQHGWKTLYVPKVLAKGLAPHDLGNYINQQYRWARGSLEVIFKYNPLFKKGLTWAQKLQYLYSSGYYLNGIIILIDALIPLFALTFNVLPVKAGTQNYMIYFFPFIFLTIYILLLSTNFQITFNAIQLSMSSFFVFCMAVLSTILGRKVSFKVTSKSQEGGNFLKLVIPHLVYVGLSVIAIAIGINRNGFVPSVITNSSWALFNIFFFWGFIRVAYPWATIPARVAYFISEQAYSYFRSKVPQVDQAASEVYVQDENQIEE